MVIPPMFFEIVYILIWLMGIFVVAKSRHLTQSYKCIWIILILLF